VWIYFMFDALETRGGAAASSAALSKETQTASVRAGLRGASSPPLLISTAHGNGSSTFLREVWNITSATSNKTNRLVGDDGGCDALLCGMSGVGKSTLLHNAKVGTVEHACFPVPSEWRAFVICAEILTRPLDGATTTWMVRGGLPGAKPNGPCAQVRGGLTIARTFCR
jgi:hypothetical protein